MRRFAALFLILTAAVTMAIVPVYGERLTADGVPEATETNLVYYNVSYPSGQIMRRFELKPRNSLLYNADGSAKTLQSVVFNIYYKSLSEALKNTGYEVALEENTLSATIVYESLTDLYIAMGETGFSYDEADADSGSSTETGFFFNTTRSEMTTVWAAADDPDTIPGLFTNAAVSLGEKEENLRFSYLYGTKYRPEAIDSDADDIERIDGVYYHEFVFDAEHRDRTVTFTQRNPNATGWYSVAIVAGLAIAAGFTAFILIKRKKIAKIAGK